MQIRVLIQGSLCLFGLAQAAAAISSPSGSSGVLLPPALEMWERPEGAPAPFSADHLNASAPYLATLADLDALEAQYKGHTRIEVVAGRAAVLYVGEHGDEPAWHVGTVSPQAVTEMLASCEADAEGERNADEAAGSVVSLAAQTRCSRQCLSRLASRMGGLSAKYLVSETGVITTPDAQVEYSPTFQMPEEVDVSETPAKNAQRSSAKQSDDEAFPFMRLPLEIRTIIWEETLPRHRRLITSHIYGGRFAPLPPILAHVCRESRSIALCHGSYHYISCERHRAWFRPKIDVVYWELGDSAFPDESSINHAVKHLAICYDPTETPPTGINFQKSVEYIAHRLECWQNLRTIDVVLSSPYGGLGKINWESTTAEELFGDHTVVTIDLRDEVEFSRANKILQQERSGIGRSHLANLIKARRVLDGSNQTVSTSWIQILSRAQYSWLKGAYKREQGQVTDAVKVKRDYTTWDLNHPWIKRTLAVTNSGDPDTSYSEESE
ncbi:hypothetical protein DL770_002870 [Monosporascus sp. CRB-9-2]|nr:hypothetical protein DL770_002870 [Monosporascus sp. CRB-9-2]